MPRLASLLCAGCAAALIAPPVAVRRRTIRSADWQRYEDAASGDPYWHDAETGATTWDDPNTPVVDPYADWQAAVDPTTGGTYYYTADGRTSWDWPPVEAPAAAPAARARWAARRGRRGGKARKGRPGQG